jgi:hypothetical protein
MILALTSQSLELFPVKYKLGFYIPEDYILHSHRRENLKSYKNTLRLPGMNEATLHTNHQPRMKTQVLMLQTKQTNKLRGP